MTTLDPRNLGNLPPHSDEMDSFHHEPCHGPALPIEDEAQRGQGSSPH